MKEEIKNIINMVQNDKELPKSEREIRDFLFKEEPKIRRIHDKMMKMLDKHYKENENFSETSYLALLLLECTYIQTMLCKLYGTSTPAEDLAKELKNANL